MVCNRCRMAVEETLKDLNIPFQKVLLGEIYLAGELSLQQKELLQKALITKGFELIDNHTTGIIEKVKKYVILKARNEVSDKEKKLTLSSYLLNYINHEYTYLSSLFSSIEGRTIESFYIEQRIEKAKELIVYGQLTLSEIAHELDYSSVAYLSAQFKKVTGLTPSHFKEVGISKRKALDEI